MRRIACLLVLLASGCSDQPTSPSGPEASAPPPAPPPPASTTLSGTVFESTSQGARPLAKAELEIWVEVPGRGYHAGSVVTDAEGRYVIRDLPDRSFVVLKAYVPDSRLIQQCAATVTMVGDAVLDIELVSTVMPLRATHGSPTLSGVIYEGTSAGIRPIQGAWVAYDWGCDDGTPEASTTTDFDGRYELCRLPLPSFGKTCVYARAGNRFQSLGIEFRGDTVLDIDMGESTAARQ